MICTKAAFARGLRQTEQGLWIYAPHTDGKGVNKSTVTRWGQAGNLVLTQGKTKQVMVQQSLAAINAALGHRADVTERHAQQRGTVSADIAQSVAHNATDRATDRATQAATQAANPSTGDDLNPTSAEHATVATPSGHERSAYQAAALDYKNKQMKLEEALNRGIRLNKDQYHQDLAKQGGKIKSGVERLIDNLAPQISKITDPNERQAKIQHVVTLLLEQIQ